MKLNEFITDTLTQIAEGINGAKDKYRELGGEINPRNIPLKSTETVLNQYSNPHGSYVSTSLVNFEIALTDNETVAGRSEIGVFFGSARIGVKSMDTTNEKTFNKVSFTIPVILP